MTTLLLITLVVVDLILIAIVFYRRSDQAVSPEILQEITQGKRELRELTQEIKDEIRISLEESQTIFKKINAIAAESDVLLNSYQKTLNDEVKGILDEFAHDQVRDQAGFQKSQDKLRRILSEAQSEGQLLKQNIVKAQKISRFFQKKIPYEELLEEIEDKKYMDARHLLAKGYDSAKVAEEVGLPINEVNLIASIG